MRLSFARVRWSLMKLERKTEKNHILINSAKHLLSILDRAQYPLKTFSLAKQYSPVLHKEAIPLLEIKNQQMVSPIPILRGKLLSVDLPNHTAPVQLQAQNCL